MSLVGAGHDQHRAESLSQGRRLQILILLCFAQFMVVLDVTVVNVALPSIGHALNLSRDTLTWVVTGYTLGLGSLLIFGGRLADALGRKAVFLAGLALFTAASMTAGLAGDGAMLLSSRVVQGIGAAVLSPSALAIMTTEFTGDERNRAFGVWAAIGGAGAVIGVVVGGALTTALGWRWVFLINVPVGVVVGLLVPRVVPRRPRGAAARQDVLGALMGCGSVALLMYGLIRAGDSGWSSAAALVPIFLGLVGAAGFVLVERRAPAPLLPMDLLRRPPLPGAVLVMVSVTGLLYSAFFLNSIYLQDVRRLSPLHVGLVFLPVAFAMIIGAHLAVRLVTAVGARYISVASLALTAAGLLLLAFAGVNSGGLAGLLAGFAMTTMGTGAALVAATATGLSGEDQQHAGLASGILNTGHELGGSLGIAVVSAVAAASIAPHAGAEVAGFQHAFLATGIAAAVMAAAAAVLVPAGRPAAGTVLLH
jgi:EmrB/QacA subfamily drug resistance transporter